MFLVRIGRLKVGRLKLGLQAHLPFWSNCGTQRRLQVKWAHLALTALVVVSIVVGASVVVVVDATVVDWLFSWHEHLPSDSCVPYHNFGQGNLLHGPVFGTSGIFTFSVELLEISSATSMLAPCRISHLIINTSTKNEIKGGWHLAQLLYYM